MMEYPSACNDSMVNPPCNRSSCHVVDASRHSPMPAYGRKYHPYQLKAAKMDALVPHLDRHLCFWKSSKLRVSFAPIFLDEKNITVLQVG